MPRHVLYHLHRFGEVSQAQVFPYGIVAIKWLKVGQRNLVFSSKVW